MKAKTKGIGSWFTQQFMYNSEIFFSKLHPKFNEFHNGLHEVDQFLVLISQLSTLINPGDSRVWTASTSVQIRVSLIITKFCHLLVILNFM